MSVLRKIQPIGMPNIQPNEIKDNKISMIWVKPTDLYVEPQYQRNITGRSITLIRKLVAGWDWARVKPPICGKSGGKLFVVDGQHTAIAAACHPGIDKIPVIVVPNLNLKERAGSFIGHNRDRLQITPLQMHYAAVAAGDEIAIALQEAAVKSGVNILKYPPAHGIFEMGDLICISIASGIVKKRGVNGAARAFKILVKAKRAPISASELKAVALLLWGDKKKAIDEADLSTVIRSKSIKDWNHKAARLKEKTPMSIAHALAALWLKEMGI